MALLSCDLTDPVEYSADNELDFNLHFEAPTNTGKKKFYVLGGLYTDTSYLSGSLFGILRAVGVDYGINDLTYASIYELEPEESVDLPCKFILNKTDCLLALFLMELVGDEINIDNDIEVAQIQVQLVSPIPIGEQVGGIISQYVTPLAFMGMMVGVLGIIGKEVFRR